jgi:conjugative relaxase-like TrwC/TraI family protein
VLKIHVVRPGGYRYYVEGLLPGPAEGTVVAGESPGQWTGRAASGLGVAGTVEPGGFAEILEGRDPRSGATLRVARGARSVSGFDLTFCAPKSVSLLHLLAPREIATEVGEGHQAAVAEATGYLERTALGVRRGHHGRVTLLPSTGAVAGQFVHRTSRALDPHLHTHLVVANVAEGVDGVWSSLDSRRVFAHLGAAGGVYHARLRMELSSRIGAAWDVPPSGLGDVKGVEKDMRRLFSRRSASIDEYRAPGPGRSTARSRAVAAHATRPDKDRTRTVESLLAEWKERAADSGFDLGDLTRVVGPRRLVEQGPGIERGRVCDRLGQLGHGRHSLARRDVVAAVAAASTNGASARVIESVATHIVEESGAPVSVGGPGAPGPVTSLGSTRTGEPRWTAAALVRTTARQPEELMAMGESQGPTIDDAAPRAVPDHRLTRGRERSGDPELGGFRARRDIQLGR